MQMLLAAACDKERSQEYKAAYEGNKWMTQTQPVSKGLPKVRGTRGCTGRIPGFCAASYSHLGELLQNFSP